MEDKLENSKIKVNDVRRLSPLNYYRYNSFTGHFISSTISPFFTIFFLRHRVKPNTITIFMILAGIIGSVLFALPYTFSKICGIIFFHLWFIMDCSDGEVARISKVFSKYGKEMDFMAHLIDHPLMNLSLWITFITIDVENWFVYSLLFIVFISLELINRNLTLFNNYIVAQKSPKEGQRSFLKYLVVQFNSYPNFILIYPIILVISILASSFNIGWYVLCIWFAIYSILTLKSIFRFLHKFYFSY